MDSLVGFRFVPNNEEIIQLLKKKRSDPDFSVHAIKEINIYGCDPWELPRHAEIQFEELVWYFFCEPYYKYAKSKRAHRRTNSGYWKVTSTVSDVKAKNSNDVIASKRILSFYRLSSDSKTLKTEWVMHEFYVEDDESLYKKEFVVCRIERKRDNKPRTSTRDKGQSSQNSVSSSTFHVSKENASPESQLPPNHNSISHLRNHVAENASPESQLPPNHNSISHPRNHVAENASPELQPPQNHTSISHPRNHVAENASPESQLPPNHNLISHLRNHVAENGSPESQLPPNHNLISHPRNHVAENAFPELQLPLDHNLISHLRNHIAENTSAESQLAASHNFISYANDVAKNESPVSHPVIHVTGNTFQDSSKNGCGSLNSHLDNEQVDCQINSQRAFNNECSPEESGHTFTPDFNSWKSNGGFDISDADPETFNAWVNELFVN